MTGGQSNDQKKTIENARRLKNNIKNSEIFVVAVGSLGQRAIYEMANVASEPAEQHVFQVYKNSDLGYVFDLALEKIDHNRYKAKKPLKPLCS